MAEKILWAVIGGFLGGVLLRSFVPVGLAFAGFACVLGGTGLCICFAERSKLHPLVIIAVACCAFGGGIARMDVAVLTGDPALTTRLDQKVMLTGTVLDEPDAREGSTLVTILVRSLVLGSTTLPVHAKVLAQAPPHTDVSYGDEVRVSGTLRLPQAFDTGAGRQFDYPQYLAASGIGYQLEFAQVSKTGKNDGNFLKAAAIDVKQLYLRGEDSALPEPEAGLAGGITVGDKRSIGPELSAAFQRDSLIHMIVLSGYNITVVINAVARIFAWTPRYLQFGASGFVVFFFILMSGGASSAVRAGAMALLAVFARATGRVYLAGRILGVVAVGMVLYNPFTLAFDPSFELSALATLGLVAFTPLFAERLHWLTERFGLREIASSTLGTQLAVLPLLLYQNGSLSIVALPANLLALAPVPFAMLASFIAAIGGMLVGPYAVPIAFPAYLLLSYIIGVAKFFAGLPFAAVSVPAFSAWWMIAAYVVMFGCLFFMQEKDPEGFD